MKGIELMTIAYAFIALAAVGLFITFFSKAFPDISTSIYCQLYQAVNAIIFLTTKPPLPPECSFEPRMERVTIGSGSLEYLSEQLTEHIMSCWEKGQRGAGGSTFICYELYFKNVEGEIGERAVTDLLIKGDKCKILPNNFLDLLNVSNECGDENKLVWESDIITGTFVVKYDAFKRIVVVK